MIFHLTQAAPGLAWCLFCTTKSFIPNACTISQEARFCGDGVVEREGNSEIPDVFDPWKWTAGSPKNHYQLKREIIWTKKLHDFGFQNVNFPGCRYESPPKTKLIEFLKIGGPPFEEEIANLEIPRWCFFESSESSNFGGVLGGSSQDW